MIRLKVALLLIFIIIFASCQSELIQIDGVNAWANLMPGSEPQLFIIGNAYASENSLNSKNPITLKISQNGLTIFNNVRCKIEKGTNGVLSFKSLPIKINEKLDLDNSLQVVVKINLDNGFVDRIFDEVKLEKAY